MKRVMILVCLLAGMIAIMLWYIRPEEKLDLSYSFFAVSDKVKEMIQNKHLAFHLTEEDVNNLLKKELKTNPQVGNGLKITGAAFELQGDQLISHINLLYYDLVPIGCRITYLLKWESPYLRAVPITAKVKSLTIPQSVLSIPGKQLSVSEMLPSFFVVKNVSFENKSIFIQLHFK